MKKPTLILTLVVFSVACSSDDPVARKGVEVFQVIIDKSYDTEGSGDWLVAHDLSGNLIYSSRFETGDTIKIQSPDPAVQQLSITFFATVASAVRTFSLKTYTHIPIGGEWVLRKRDQTYETPRGLGLFTITATDLPPNNLVVGSTHYGINGTFEPLLQIPYAQQGKFMAHANTPQLVFLRDAQDNLRYKFFEGVSEGQDISFTYADLQTPETIIEVNLEGYEDYILSVAGSASKRTGDWSGYDLGHAYREGKFRSVKIGYIDRLKFFKTNLRVYTPVSMVQYEKTGGVPESINLPTKVEQVLTSAEVTDFSASLNVPFERRHSYWYHQQQGVGMPVIEWTIDSPTGEHKLGPIPNEITELFPMFSISKLRPGTTEFILSGSSYTDLIESTFQGKAMPDEYEIFSASFW
ncbi:MAG TPA: hypothetical protein VGD40_05390 [Chryseosolibacter sp.]